jgi:hypothetical protein
MSRCCAGASTLSRRSSSDRRPCVTLCRAAGGVLAGPDAQVGPHRWHPRHPGALRYLRGSRPSPSHRPARTGSAPGRRQETDRSLPEVMEAILNAGLLDLEAERTEAEVVTRDGERDMTVRVRLPIRAPSHLAPAG